MAASYLCHNFKEDDFLFLTAESNIPDKGLQKPFKGVHKMP